MRRFPLLVCGVLLTSCAGFERPMMMQGQTGDRHYTFTQRMSRNSGEPYSLSIIQNFLQKRRVKQSADPT